MTQTLAVAFMALVAFAIVYVLVRLFVGPSAPIPPLRDEQSTEQEDEQHTIAPPVYTRDRAFAERMREWLG